MHDDLLAQQYKEGVSRRVAMAEGYRDLLLLTFSEAMTHCLARVLKMIESHNGHTPPGSYASKQAIIACFQSVAENMEGELSDAFADLIVDLQRAVEESEE